MPQYFFNLTNGETVRDEQGTRCDTVEDVKTYALAVAAERNSEAWEVNETSDRVGRLDPRTAEITNYLLPRNGNIRRVFVDDRSNPVTIWIGNNLAASIVKIEPLD
jgi:streptogramin lyase